MPSQYNITSMPISNQLNLIQILTPIVAVGVSVLALITAVISIFRQGAAERRRDKLRASCLAVSIVPALYEVEAAVRHAVDIINQHLPWNTANGDGETARVIRQALIQLPVPLTRNVGDLWMLGNEAGPIALQLVGIAEQHNEFISSFADRVAAGNVNDVFAPSNSIIERLTLLQKLVEVGKIKIGRLYGYIPS